MNRAAATAYLTEEYRELAVDAKFTSQQTTDAYNTALDNSLRKLGVAELDLNTADVAQSDIETFLALLNYYALKRFVRLLALRFDVAAGQGALDAKRSQAFQAVQTLIGEAEAELASLGIVVGGQAASSYQMGRLTLDFLEPSCTGEF